MALLKPLSASLVLAGALLGPARGADPPSGGHPTEFRLKAACLFNFAKFVEWPPGTFPDPRDPLIFAVLGEDPFGEILDETFRGKTIAGRDVVVKRFPALEKLETCHVLFVSRSMEEELSGLWKALRGRPVLTVSDLEGFAAEGGIIRFLIDNDRVRFEINPDAAQRAELRVSAKLLQVGRIVRDPPSPVEGR